MSQLIGIGIELTYPVFAKLLADPVAPPSELRQHGNNTIEQCRKPALPLTASVSANSSSRLRCPPRCRRIDSDVAAERVNHAGTASNLRHRFYLQFGTMLTMSRQAQASGAENPLADRLRDQM